MKHHYLWRGCAALFFALPAAAQSPTVSTLAPGRNATAASRSGNVTLTFSQNVDAATVGNMRVFSGQYEGRKPISYNSGGNAVVLVPTRAFKPGETVQVTVPATVTAGGLPVTPQVYQFTANAAVALATFTTGSEVSVGGSPRYLTTADVDGDGDLDLITAENPITTTNTQGTITIRLNNGLGSFSGGSTITMNDASEYLTMADIDGDGDLDMVMTVSNQNEVRIRLNNGQGTFAAGSTIQMLYFPSCVVTADVDADGDLDLITANTSSSMVDVRLNNGSGGFTAAGYVSTGNPGSLAVADIDNDGDLDIVAANTLSNTVRLLLNNGRGSFTAGSTLTVVGSARKVLAADLNGDGDVDVAVLGVGANNSGSSLNIFDNFGNGIIAASQVKSFGLASDAQLADVDGDGDLDILVSKRTTVGELAVLPNDGTGLFSSGPTYQLGNYPSSLATADVDGDGDIDALQTNGAFNGTVSVRLNGGTAVLATQAAQAALLGVYPNPARTQVQVQAPAGAARVLLYDALGRLARTVPAATGAAPTLLPVAGLPAGMYVVRAGAATARLLVE